MSTHRHFDRICCVILAVTLVIAAIFVNAGKLGVESISAETEYENTLFDTSRVHSIDISMDDWDEFIENCTSEEYYDCDVEIDGETYSNVAIRGKGNTSLTQVASYGNDRYSFKIEFDHYDSGSTYYGLDKLCLNNIIQDNTYMKDYLVYQMMGSMGVASPLCSYVYITVNGEDWGLYLAVEGVEDAFLQRNYGSSHGELYKPDSSSMGGGRGNGGEFEMGDLPDGAGDIGTEDRNDAGGGQLPDGDMPDAPGGFSQDKGGGMGSPPQDMESADDGGAGAFPGEHGDMQGPGTGDAGAGGGMGSSDDVLLKYIDDDIDSYPNIFDNAKTDVSDSDRNRLIKSLKKLSDGEDLEDTVDVDEVIKYFAVHDFVLNFDSYTGSMIHNYYLYEEDGQMQMIPWDYNLAFGGFVSSESAESLVNYPIDSPVSGGSTEDRPMIAWIFENEEYTALYHEYLEQFVSEYFDSGYFETMIDNVVSMISPYVEKDPTKFCSYEEFQTGVETLKEFCLLRAQSVSLQLDGEIGSTSDTQESSTLVDAGDLQISDMGTMNAAERSDQNGESAKPQDGANAGVNANAGADENIDTAQVPDSDTGSGEIQAENGMDQPPGGGDMQAIQEQEKPDRSEMQNSLSAATLAWLSASAAVLAAGLLTAAVYRRRRYKKQ